MFAFLCVDVLSRLNLFVVVLFVWTTCMMNLNCTNICIDVLLLNDHCADFFFTLECITLE